MTHWQTFWSVHLRTTTSVRQKSWTLRTQWNEMILLWFLIDSFISSSDPLWGPEPQFAHVFRGDNLVELDYSQSLDPLLLLLCHPFLLLHVLLYVTSDPRRALEPYRDPCSNDDGDMRLVVPRGHRLERCMRLRVRCALSGGGGGSVDISVRRREMALFCTFHPALLLGCSLSQLHRPLPSAQIHPEHNGITWQERDVSATKSSNLFINTLNSFYSKMPFDQLQKRS